MFGVVVCPSCRKARIVEPGRKTATCAHCDRTLRLGELALQHRSESVEEARHAVGVLNARHAGLGDAYAEALAVAEGSSKSAPLPRHDDAADRAAARTRGARGEAAKVDAVARALSEDGPWDEAALADALDRAGIARERAEAHLARMLAAHVVFEPAPGRYRAL